jgi:hypothetical protein
MKVSNRRLIVARVSRSGGASVDISRGNDERVVELVFQPRHPILRREAPQIRQNINYPVLSHG